MRFFKQLFIFIIIVLLSFCSCDFNIFENNNTSYKTGFVMGSVFEQSIDYIDLYDDYIFQEISSDLTALENLISEKIDQSDIYKINNSSELNQIYSPKTIPYLTFAKELNQKTNGYYDITSGQLVNLWGFGSSNARVPSQSEIDSAISSISSEHIKINGDYAYLDNQNCSLDFGSMGKGIACDIVLQKYALYENKIKWAVFSLGGSSIAVFGEKETPFKISIRNPYGTQNNSVGYLSIKSGTVSTSGNYEKVLETEDKTYHHILNPFTGYSSDNELVSVTVLHPSGMVSDALSTACFLIGIEKSLPLLSEYNAEAIFINNKNQILLTGNLNESFTLKDPSGKFSVLNI
jgi:Membrane-associated lipoprotein involved in thiamine biosynthesis